MLLYYCCGLRKQKCSRCRKELKSKDGYICNSCISELLVDE